MTSSFSIKSSRSDAELVFNGIESDYFTVEIRGREVSAVRRVWGYTDCQLLVDLFHHLAQQEKGWEAPLEWSSIESELKVRFRSDSHGHVFIDIEIRREHGEEDWRIEAEIQTELGQLPKIAADAVQFFQCNA
jgi:hypothetical protein